MRSRKSFSATGNDIELQLIDSIPESPSLDVQPSAVFSGTIISLEKWIGLGINDWVYLAINQLNIQKSRKQLSDSSLVTYGRQCIPHFLQFILQSNPKIKPSQFSSANLQQYIQEIDKTERWVKKTKQTMYCGVRATLMGLAERGLIALHLKDFPDRPFGIGDDSSPTKPASKPDKALTDEEAGRLYEALKQDMVAIHQKKFARPAHETLVVVLLAIALRTGINTTPLLELQRDALEPHPFLPTMRVLRTLKRRSRTENLKPLTAETPSANGIPLDGVGMFEFALAITSDVSLVAPERLKNYVWLYRKEVPGKRPSIEQLNYRMLRRGISSITRRHRLVDKNGQALCINLSNIRATVENRLWDISGGKADKVALAMGHTVNVSDRHYLQVTDEMRVKAGIFAAEIPAFVRQLAARESQNNFNNTPIGKCGEQPMAKESIVDAKSMCGDFMQCFRCSSFAVAGSLEDLYRLYSYYWFLFDTYPNTERDENSQQALHIREKIDAIVNTNFDRDLGQRAKSMALKNPHPFWKQFRAISEARLSK